MAQEEPSVEELKRLLRRLEKLEPLEPQRGDGLASLRTPLPPSEHFAIPSPRPSSDSALGSIPTPLVLAPDVAKPPTIRAEPPIALVAVTTDERKAQMPAAPPAEARGGARGLLMALAALVVAGSVGAYLLLLPPAARNSVEPRPPSQGASTPPAVEAPAAAVAAAPIAPSTPTAQPVPPSPALPAGAASGAAPEAAPTPDPSSATSPAVDATSPPAIVVEAPAPPFATIGALVTAPPAITPEVAVQPAPPPAPAVAQPAVQPSAPTAPEPTGPRLVTAANWGIGAGRRTAIPLVIDPPSAVMDHYVLIEGLERDAFVSRGIEVLGGTWMVRGADLDAAEIERSATAPESAAINLELRHIDGSIVGRQRVSLTAPSQERASMPAQPGASEPPRAGVETNLGSDAQRLLRRGQLMLDSGNLSGARLLWERAAEQGSSEAALALGRSYDPAQVPLPGVAGSVADRALARRWYERAAALGSSEAGERAKRLD